MEKNSEKEEKNFQGRWTKDEHRRFLEGLKLYGKTWKKVQEYVGTRTAAQIRSHAQKYFIKSNIRPSEENSPSPKELSEELIVEVTSSASSFNAVKREKKARIIGPYKPGKRYITCIS